MSSLNKVILIGRTGKEVETKKFDNGQISNVSIATSETWKDKDGNKQEATEWHNLVFRNKLSEIVDKWLKKGDLIYVEGKIKNRKWQDKDGNDRYITEIIVFEMKMFGSKSDSSQTNTTSDDRPEYSKDKPDDLPF